MPTTQYTDATFGVREIAGRTDASGVDVDDLPLDEDRIINHLLTEGFLTADAFKVVADSPASMTVKVGSGTAKADLYVVEGDDDGQHPYVVRLDDATVNLVLDAADASNPRLDEVWLVVADAVYDGGSVSLPRLAVRKGDPSSSPAAPGPDAGWKAAVKLATVTVGTAASSIGTADIADNRREAVFAAGVPVAEVKMTAAATTPSGWLDCNGQAVSRSTYARLFAAIGTSYGAGDGSTTFNIPNLAGRVPIGAGTLGSDTYSRGSTGGSARHTLTNSEMPAHDHGGSAGANGSHNHGGATFTSGSSHTHNAGGDLTISGGTHTHSTDMAGTGDVDHGHSTSSPSTRLSSGPTSGALSGTQTISSSGSGHSHSISGTTGSSGSSHTHAIPSEASHAHSISSQGGGSAHENRPPYLGVRFIIFAAA